MNTKRILICLIAAVALSSSFAFAQTGQSDKVQLFAKGGLGYGFADNLFRGVIAVSGGAYADIAITNPIVLQTGLEVKTNGYGMNTEYSGLSGSSSDFYEIYHYHFAFVSVPVLAKLYFQDRPDDGLNGIYLGFGLNFPLGGSANWKRYKTGLKSKSVDASGSSTIDASNLKSPVVSFRFGFDQRINNKWGLFFDCEMPSIAKKSGSAKVYSVATLGAIYYL